MAQITWKLKRTTMDKKTLTNVHIIGLALCVGRGNGGKTWDRWLAGRVAFDYGD